MNRHTCVECGQSPPAPSWHEVEDGRWVDTDCYRKRQARVLLADEIADQRARADAAEMALAELREAFVNHRTATHETAPTYCKTCAISDAILAQPVPERGAALLAAAEEMHDAIRHGIRDGAPFRDCNETGCPHPWCAILHARKRWRALGRGGEGR